jgi:hypothetical protein
MNRSTILITLLAGLLAGLGFYHYGQSLWAPLYQQMTGQRTVAQVLEIYGPAAEQRLQPFFRRAGVAYPPRAVSLVGLKEERRLELWAAHDGRWVFVKDYPIQKASGRAGPKLREGDLQVPEGFYRIVGFNPNSSYHLSLKLDYPNAFDRRQARREGRDNLGGEIFIHGQAVSIGCLAMGDPAIEELFVLASRVGKEHVAVLLAPRDFRRRAPAAESGDRALWVDALYDELRQALANYPLAGRVAAAPGIGATP